MKICQDKISKENIKFVPANKGNGWYAIAIAIDGKISGYLHWIEISNGAICSQNRLDLARNICETYPMINAYCKELQKLFKNNDIGFTNVNLKK